MTGGGEGDRLASMDAEQAARHNSDVFMERGPGLWLDYQTFVVARRPSTGEVLIGGLGVMGVGQMWFTEDEDAKSRPGYADAEIVD